MMKKITMLLLLVSMMIPMTLCAQKVKKNALTDGAMLKSDCSMLKKNVPAPANKQVQNFSKFTKGISLHRAPKAAPSADAVIWDFETEEQLDDWTLVDNDGDGFGWIYYNNAAESLSMKAHDGDGLVTSSSYDSEREKALNPDNWMISPEVNLGGMLSLWACGQDASWCGEVFGVFVCVGNSIDPDDFVQVETDITATGVMTEYTFDLSEYAGKTGRFAIRHYNISDMFMLNIDDVCLDVNATYVPDPTDPTNLTADPAATTADVAWDGAEGDSWNLRYRVYNPDDIKITLWDFTVDNYSEQFDEGWYYYDMDEDGDNWTLTYGGYDPTGQTEDDNNAVWCSYSWYNEALYPDNWLITPDLTLGGTFKFWAQNDKYPDVLGVYVVTDEDFYQIGDDITPPQEWTEYSFDTSEFNGLEGAIAIRHYNCSDQFGIYVDYLSYEEDFGEWIEVDGISKPNYTIEGLEPGTDYVVEVQAFNEKSKTEWTEPTYFTTLSSVNVSVSAADYATLYYGNVNLVVPEGVEASAITVEDGSMVKSQIYATGDVIPQGTGVLIQASEGDYVFEVTSEEGTVASDNMLRGSDEEEETTGGDIYLMLSLNANSDPESVGFYYGADNGAPFINGAHKAYLALTEEQAAGVKYLWFNTTSINSIETLENNSKDVFTITGMHVNKHANLPKGFYIVGGKKVVVK